MAAYDITIIRANLKTLLQTASLISVVYDYRTTDISGYPAIIFDMTNESGEMLDDANNVRKITFTIWILTELQVAGMSTAKTKLDNVVKEVINILEKKDNATLSGSVDWLMPSIGVRGETQSGEGTMLYQEIKLDCNVASTIL